MKCEAYFYVAEHLFLAGKNSKANAFYKKCLSCDIPEFLESKEAEVRIGESVSP
jgi:lipoprotein NlpI